MLKPWAQRPVQRHLLPHAHYSSGFARQSDYEGLESEEAHVISIHKDLLKSLLDDPCYIINQVWLAGPNLTNPQLSTVHIIVANIDHII